MAEAYAQNCRKMIGLNKDKVKETEEKIRLFLQDLATRDHAGPKERKELEHLQMELDGWAEWVERWETALASVTGDAN